MIVGLHHAFYVVVRGTPGGRLLTTTLAIEGGYRHAGTQRRHLQLPVLAPMEDRLDKIKIQAKETHLIGKSLDQ